MDARPCRPARPLPTVGNENLAPAKQTIHQRHKSTGHLLGQATAGGLQGAAKRSAFADRSNTAKSVILPYDDSKMVKSHHSQVAKSKENDTSGHGIPKDAFSRPAQRPSSKGASNLPSVTNSYIMPLAGGDSHLPPHKQSKRATTIVYNDNRPATSSGSSEAVSEHIEALRGLEYPGPAAPLVRQPRHHQSQPALNSSQQALQQQTETIPPQDTYVDSSTHWDFYSNDYDLADDNIPEAPYLDALEELPQEQFPVLKPTKGHFHCGPSVAEQPDMHPTNLGTIQPSLPSLPAEEPLEISDYEDEDYYDDQGYTTAHSYRSRGDTTTGGTTMVVFPPKLSKKGLAEIEEAKDIVERNRTDEEMEDEAWDISMVAEYGDEIFAYMKELEMNLLPAAHYMEIQTEIQWSMRSVLMDWVIQVHGRFSLLPETLFLTVNYIDRFLSVKVVSLGKLQLVGATAIFVAAKYEEINCPSVQEIVYMVDSGYSIDEILKAERFMLSMLNFELGWPGPMSFLRRISKADDYDLETRTLAKYFLEVTVMDERFVASPASYLAAGAHCLSRLILDKGDWSPDHVYYSGYTFTQLKPLVSTILECCRIARRHHAAVFEKYKDKRFKKCALYVEKELKRGFCLPFQQTLPFPTNLESLQDDLYMHPQAFQDQGHTGTLKMPIPTQG
ncbi:cyclin [Xylariales sp. AK1849]|nr:cyclin [Xylariales sp. AK1849]